MVIIERKTKSSVGFLAAMLGHIAPAVEHLQTCVNLVVYLNVGKPCQTSGISSTFKTYAYEAPLFVVIATHHAHQQISKLCAGLYTDVLELP
jgi:hypothetical protein